MPTVMAVPGRRWLARATIDGTPRTDARFAFVAGEQNRCFLAESQRRTHEHFDRLRKEHHTRRLVPGCSHLDVFMGQQAARDVFPLILQELDGTD